MSRVLPVTERMPAWRATGLLFAFSELFQRARNFAVGAIALAVAAVIVGLGSLAIHPALAQRIEQRNPNAQLLLKADQLIYDNDAQVVTAIGDVQLDYDGFNVVAERVSYNQRTRRVTASGNVEIIEPDGNRIYADSIDLTDDFGDGFVDALRVETPDNTRFAAESAERFSGEKTVFNNGVYTACEPCRDNPGKAPIWQVKARQVILNGITKDVTYRDATFELFGRPIAYLPYFSHADPSVKRKSGFLVPRGGHASDLGHWYNQRYFLVTGDSHDLTAGLTGFTKQGVLADLKWRHQLENGFYTLRIAGIRQNDPAAFKYEPDRLQTRRGMFGTEGRFDINSRWTFGWDILAQSDRNFSRTYKLKDYKAATFTNQVFLRGLNNRSFFDLSAYQFLIQPDQITPSSSAFQDEDQQANVLPSLDYNYVTTNPTTGGEISFDVNVASLDRDEINQVLPATPMPDIRTHGIEGESTRVSADLAWKKTHNTDAGLMVTPSLSMRGDFTSVDNERDAAVAVQEGSSFRYMPTAGLQVSYPVLARTQTSSHVFEPIGQLLVRPSLSFDGVLPNEDSQSLVFDTTTLFQRDKFSGYDRIEGGTRLNAGLRYSGIFGNGLTLTALVGQSYHLAGRNPYAREDDLVNAGEESGLENDQSDIVASLGFGLQGNLLVNLQGRFDEDDLGLHRGETSLEYSNPWLRLTGNYTFIDSQPDYGFATDRQQIGFTASLKVIDNWYLFGGAQYGIDDNVFVSDSIGFRYHDECFTFSLAFSESRNLTGEPYRLIGFRVSLRTIGDFGGSIDKADLFGDPNETAF
ncbi:MAG: LPS-assembly protein LptD [Rhizobiaceae bacterium]